MSGRNNNSDNNNADEKGDFVMKIAADIDIPFLKGEPECFADEVAYFSSSGFCRDVIADADAVIVRTPDCCDEATLCGTRVKFIATASVGFDHIDVGYCVRNGIAWANAPGANAGSVAQYLLSTLVRVSLKHNFELKGKTIGLIGVGNAGKAVATVCRAWGLNVLLNDPPRAEKEGDEAFVSLDTICEECDIVSFHTPLTKTGKHKTHHLAGCHFFENLRKKPIFVNAARGGINDTEALKSAIKTGKISAVVIDCWEGEPSIDAELLELADVATPHIAGFSFDGKANGTRMAIDAVKKFFRVNLPDFHAALSAPKESVIDLSCFPRDRRLEYAVLHTLDTTIVNEALKASPHDFEFIRSHYENPREFKAYTLLGATPDEQQLLQALGFSL